MGRPGRLLRATLLVCAGLTAQAGAGGGAGDEVGLPELIERLGQDVPTGAGVVVGMAEANAGSQQNPLHYPDTSLPQFAGKTFTEISGPLGVSNHASTVAGNFYGAEDAGGDDTSIAPGIADIFLYSATGWTQNNFLKVNFPSFVPPLNPPAGLKIYNNSWIASFGNLALDQGVLRRADYAVFDDDLVIVNGVNNAEGAGDNLPLMSHLYNGISVGLADGGHQANPTLLQYDGPGRMKPEIVAPGTFTSFSTPVVSAGAALMLETAAGLSAAGGDGDASRSEVIKAVILAGAVHRAGWTNNPSTEGPDRGVTDHPIDPVFGVDLLNVDRSHLILTGGQHIGDTAPPVRGSVGHAGWALDAVPIDGSAFYRMTLPGAADETSFLITWHRQVAVGFGDGDWSVADFDLFLWRQENEELISLVGDEGLGWFEGGNVVSESPVDNVEHLYLSGLAAGDYVIEVRRQDQILSAPEWDVAVAWLFPAPPAGLPGDATGDGKVDVLDLIAVILAWGTCDGCPEDLDGDGEVSVLDLIEVILNWTD